MKRLTCPCFLILLLLTCGLKCNTDVARVMLPELTETETETDADMAFALEEMEAILQSKGEVLSPIPDDVYERLWGHFTKAGSLAPRDYYTKYIDAGGIAIVSGDLVDDRFLQVTRHIALVMTSKLPGLREALSIHQNSQIWNQFTNDGTTVPFRFTLTAASFAEDDDEPLVPIDIADSTTWPEVDAGNLPERMGGHTHLWSGACGGTVCRANVGFPPASWQGWDADYMIGINTIVHELAHAIDYEILEHNLVPDFAERLYAAFLEEGGTCAETGWFDSNHAEFSAHAVADKWLDNLFIPPDTTVLYLLNELDMPDTPENRALLAVEPDSPDAYLERCPMLTDLLAEIYPPVPLQWAIRKIDY